MGWIYLLIASLFEIGWPLGIKIATNSSHKISWIIFAIITMGLSGIFLYLAQKTIPIGIAYAIWTGIGASFTFLIGVFIFHDSINLMKTLGVVLILSGVVLIEVSN